MDELSSKSDKELLAIVAEEVGTEEGLPPGKMSKLIQTESNWNSRATSGKDAHGLMQITPIAQKDVGGGLNRFNVVDNLKLGAKYWAKQFATFGNETLADAAYNAGPGAVKKYGGVPPYKETQDYVKKTGINMNQSDDVSSMSDEELKQIAGIQDMSEEELRKIAGIDSEGPSNQPPSIPQGERFKKGVNLAAGTWNDNASRAKELVTSGLNKGSSDLLGMPVDIANTVLNVVGLGTDKPFLGSRWWQEITNPTPAKPQGFEENLYYGAGELAPGFVGPGAATAAYQGAKVLPTVANAAKMGIPALLGSATARTVSPDNPYLDMAAQVAGTIVGSKALPNQQTIQNISKIIDSVIDNGIQKGVRPLSRAGGNRVQGVERLNNAGRTVVKDMVANKENTILHDSFGDITPNNIPHNAPQMVEATQQGLSRNLKGYLTAVENVTGEKIITPTTKIEDALTSFINDPVNKVASPGTVRYATKRLKDFQGQSFDAGEFERLLQAQSSTVKKMVNNPTMNVDHLHVEAKIQKALRETQDDLMMKYDGPEYRTFKDNYAAYKQLEADVIQRARVVTRQGPYSLIDFSDIYSLPEIIGGVVSGNPMMVGKGLLTKGIAKYMKYANHPDTSIKGMFTKVDKLASKIDDMVGKQEPFILESTEGLGEGQRALPPGISAMPVDKPFTRVEGVPATVSPGTVARYEGEFTPYMPLHKNAQDAARMRQSRGLQQAIEENTPYGGSRIQYLEQYPFVQPKHIQPRSKINVRGKRD